MSRPKGISRRKKRAKTHRKYTFALEALVPPNVRGIEGKAIKRMLKAILPTSFQMATRNSELVSISLYLRESQDVVYKQRLERYRLRTESLLPRTPKVSPGTRDRS